MHITLRNIRNCHNAVPILCRGLLNWKEQLKGRKVVAADCGLGAVPDAFKKIIA